jgi:type IV secretory pathway VirB3-like protein
MLFLPLAIVFDVIFFFEPIISGFLFYLILRYGDVATFISAFAVMFFYMSANVILENTLTRKEKIYYLIITPPMYFIFYILTLAEYIGILIFLMKLPRLKESIKANNCSWDHVERSGARA